jgi:hypothetical protein
MNDYQSSAEVTIPSCKCCFEKTNELDQFCTSCGFPLRGTEEQQNNFIYERGYKKMQVNELAGKASRASVTFYIISGLMFLSGIVIFFMHPENNRSSANLIIYAIISALFLCLGVWSNKKPVAAIICGLTLYVVLILLQAAADFSTLFSGLLIKIFIIAGLVKALVSALEAERIKKQHNI